MRAQHNRNDNNILYDDSHGKFLFKELSPTFTRNPVRSKITTSLKLFQTKKNNGKKLTDTGGLVRHYEKFNAKSSSCRITPLTMNIFAVFGVRK